MNKQLLIFDLDGTLMDSRQDLAAAVNLVREHYGLKALPVETVAGYVGDGLRALIERALRGFPADLDEAARLQREFYAGHLCDRTTLYPGVAEGLPALRRAGHVLAIATNKDTAFCESLLDHFRLRPLFESVLGGGSVANLKPHPEMILKTVRTLRAAADRTWMIGDHSTDIQSARLAGVRSVFLTCGIGDAGRETPTLTLGSFAELVRKFAPAGKT